MPRISKDRLRSLMETQYRERERKVRKELCEDLAQSKSLAAHLKSYPEPIALNVGSWFGVLERTLYERFPEQFEKGFLLGIDPNIKPMAPDVRLESLAKMPKDARFPGWLNKRKLKNYWDEIALLYTPNKNILRVGDIRSYLVAKGVSFKHIVTFGDEGTYPPHRLGAYQNLPHLCKHSFLKNRKFDIIFCSFGFQYIDYKGLIEKTKGYTRSYVFTEYLRDFAKEIDEKRLDELILSMSTPMGSLMPQIPEQRWERIPLQQDVEAALENAGFEAKSGERKGEGFWYTFARRDA